MTLNERNELIKQIFENECLAVLGKKGADYMRTDAWDQFDHLSGLLGLTPLQIMYVYMNKHIKAIETAMSNKELQGECLDDKLIDIVNYALMMIAYNRKEVR